MVSESAARVLPVANRVLNQIFKEEEVDEEEEDEEEEKEGPPLKSTNTTTTTTTTISNKVAPANSGKVKGKAKGKSTTAAKNNNNDDDDDDEMAALERAIRENEVTELPHHHNQHTISNQNVNTLYQLNSSCKHPLHHINPHY